MSRSSLAIEHTRGAVEVEGELVQFETRTVDARSEEQRAADAARGRPAGNVMVVVPGHGQTVDGPRNLLATAALLCRSRIACCIDPVPCRGGDRVEAHAIAAAARAQIDGLFPPGGQPGRAGAPPVQATVVGWSHGGGEALRAASRDPDLFPQYLGLCPAGLVDRRPPEILCSFFLEALRIIARSLARGHWSCLASALRLGLNAAVGLVRDLVRSRSLRKVVNDVRWACRKVPGATFGYPGEVVLVWGERDSVVRWRDAFPGCAGCDEIRQVLPAFGRENFALAQRIEVLVLDGDHISPEVDATQFLQAGLGLLNQLGTPA